jgi:hypothetical protein
MQLQQRLLHGAKEKTRKRKHGEIAACLLKTGAVPVNSSIDLSDFP